MLYMFDMDGTLIEGFLRDWKREGLDKQPEHSSEAELELYNRVAVLPGRREKIRTLATMDPHASFALVTNQGGVAFGYQSVQQVGNKLGRVVTELEFFCGKPFSVHVCYTHPQAKLDFWRCEDDRRKPGCGMLDEAMQAHRLVNRVTAIYVGDMPTDQIAAAKAGVAYMTAEHFFGSEEV